MELEELIREVDDLMAEADMAADAGDVDGARGYLRQVKDLIVDEFINE